MTLTAPKQRIARWLGASFSCAVLGINVFTVNCGMFEPPVASDVGLRKPSQQTLVHEPTQASEHLLGLLPAHALSFVRSASTVCVAFPQAATGASIPCTVTERPSGGEIHPAVTGTCSISTSADSTPVYALTCTSPTGKCTLIGASVVAALQTDTDFDAVATDHPGGSGLDGYVVEDSGNANLTMTFHDSATYCSDTFALDD